LLIATLFFACNTPSDKVTIIQGSDLSDLSSKMVKFVDKEIIDKQLYEIDRGALFDGMTPEEQSLAHFIIGIEIIRQGGVIGSSKPLVTRPTYLYLDENGNPVWDPNANNGAGGWVHVGGCNGPWDDRDLDGIPNYWDSDVDGDGILNGFDDDVDGDGILNGDDNDMDGDGIPNGQDPNDHGANNNPNDYAWLCWVYDHNGPLIDFYDLLIMEDLLEYLENLHDQIENNQNDELILNTAESLITLINNTTEWNISLESSRTMMTVTQNSITIGRETITLEEYITVYDIPNRKVIITEK